MPHRLKMDKVGCDSKKRKQVMDENMKVSLCNSNLSVKGIGSSFFSSTAFTCTITNSFSLSLTKAEITETWEGWHNLGE